MHKVAKQNGRERHKTIEFWYRKQFNLTSNDPRFLNTTVEEMMTDYWAFTYSNDPKAADEVEDEDFDLEEELRKLEQDPDGWEVM